MRRYVALALAFAACGVCAAPAARAEPAAFHSAPCDMPGITPDIAPRLRCGTVAVPRDRERPGEGSFRLAIVVIAADHPAPDPVLYIAGGPGSPLTSRAAILARHEAAVVAPDRDLILVDTRGADRSEPSLCPDLARRQLAIFAAGPEPQSFMRKWRESYRLCRTEMAAAGLLPEWFGTVVTAADLDTVRQALGIARWNVYALSYGTAVAMTLMATHPDTLRAVVLDSVYPPDPLPMTRTQSFGNALAGLFSACQADPGCATAHPDLAASFEAATRTLEETPLSVPLRNGFGVQTVRLQAQLFRLIVDRTLYSRAGMAALPAFIEAARDRRAAALQPVIEQAARGFAEMSAGEIAAVECRDRASWQAPDRSEDAAPTATASVLHGVCRDWSRPGPVALLPHETPVPSLVLSGDADPITPRPLADCAAAAMGAHAAVIGFAHVGHGAALATPCGERIVSAFIRDPGSPPDTTCAAAIPPVTFR